MKKIYQAPDIDLTVLTAEEIRTDVISVSQPSSVDSLTWIEFLSN